ncbi:MAG: hypothetical protein LPK26_17910 [Bacillaceae bacterium]|nr:hypothetical protein [Bacillaceae bacterium]
MKAIIILLALLPLFLFVFEQQSVKAHRMIVEREKEGHITVRYDDGTSAGSAVIFAYGKSGDFIFEGQVNDDGTYSYDAAIEVYQINADDGIGHRASWVKDEETNVFLAVPVGLRALLGVSILLFICSVFVYRKHLRV